MNFLQKHERLLLALLAAGVILYIATVVTNHNVEQAEHRAGIAEQAAKEQHDQNTALAARISQNDATVQQLLTTLGQQNADLRAAITRRDAATRTQQQADRTLPTPALAERWRLLAGLNSDALTPIPNGFQIGDTAARQTVQQLEAIPGLDQKADDQQTIIANQEKEKAALTGKVQQRDQRIDGLGAELKTQAAACTADLNLAKAKGKRGFLRGFKLGVITGFVGGLFVGHTVP